MNQEQIEKLIKKYEEAESKRKFYEGLNTEQKKELFAGLKAVKKQKELVSVLPVEDIVNLVKMSKTSMKKDVLKLLSRNQLQDVYNSKFFSETERKNFVDLLEEIQADLQLSKDDYMKDIRGYASNIGSAYDSIDSNTRSIKQNKADIRSKKIGLVKQEIIIRKATKEREKAYQKYLKAERKYIEKKSRIAVISKHRWNKYKEKMEIYNSKEQALSNEERTKANLLGDIRNLNRQIADSRDLIEKQKEKIEDCKSEIGTKTRYLEDTVVKIKSLSKDEKEVLGKGLYYQQVLERDKVITRRKEKLAEESAQKSGAVPEPAVAQSSKSATQTREQSQPVLQHPSVNLQNSIDPKLASENVERLMQAFNGMGITFNYDQGKVNVYQGQELLYNAPIATLSKKENILLSMATLYGIQTQKVPAEQVQGNELQPEGRSRGSISVGIVVVLILLTLGVIMFVMN